MAKVKEQAVSNLSIIDPQKRAVDKQQNFKDDSVVQAALIHAQKLVEQYTDFEIVDSTTQNISTDLLADIKETVKTIEGRRKFFTTPLDIIIKGINAQAKSDKQPLIDLQDGIEEKKRAYMTLQQEQARKEQEKEQARMAKAIEKDKPFVPKPITEVVKKVQTESGVTESMVDDWQADIIPGSEWEFIKYAVSEGLQNCLEIKEGALKKYAAPYKGTKQIPGVRCYNRPQIKTRIG